MKNGTSSVPIKCPYLGTHHHEFDLLESNSILSNDLYVQTKLIPRKRFHGATNQRVLLALFFSSSQHSIQDFMEEFFFVLYEKKKKDLKIYFRSSLSDQCLMSMLVVCFLLFSIHHWSIHFRMKNKTIGNSRNERNSRMNEHFCLSRQCIENPRKYSSTLSQMTVLHFNDNKIRRLSNELSNLSDEISQWFRLKTLGKSLS